MGFKQILPALGASILVSMMAIPMALCSNVDRRCAQSSGQPILTAQTTTSYGGTGNSFGPLNGFGKQPFGSSGSSGFGSYQPFGFGSAGQVHGQPSPFWSSSQSGYSPPVYSGNIYSRPTRSRWYRGPSYPNPDLPIGARALKKATVWEAPHAGDRQLKQAIQASEIDNGPDDPTTVRLIVEAAKYYVKTKQFEKAEPMLKRLNRLGVSNSETAALQSAVSAGLRPADLRYRAFMPYLRDQRARQPVQIQPPSSLDQAFPRFE